MADTADVVVIGGGMTGTSIAYHLAARGVAVTLCERGDVGSGIDVTPDYLPYLGWIEAVEGLLLAYGMSSHFFKHAPAVGRSIAELVVDGASSIVDLEFFRPERFRDNEPRRSPHPYPDSVTL
jgi:glycine/D-amino acid oxidase-like deaminating enzyme